MTPAIIGTRTLALLVAATLAGACSSITTSNSAIPALTAGQTWVVPATTRTRSLSIPEGARLVAPPGKSLTLTVDGVGTAIMPGSYQGNVVLTVTDNIVVKYSTLDPHLYRAALYVKDGKVVDSQSVTSAVKGGSFGDSAARNVSITSNEDRFNGIYVTGKSTYTINKPTIRFTGNGGNDFAGFGAAIAATGDADVTVNDASIINKGAVRSALFVGGNATLRINNANIETYSGTLPKDYVWNVEVGKMFEVPWMLGLSGNVRSSNIVDNGTLYINKSHIKTDGWGALSADDPKKVRMYVTDSVIEAVGSGYGAYSIGDSIHTFTRTTFNVADIGVIIAGEGSAVFTDNTKVNSGRFGIMLHTGTGGGNIVIEKGTVFDVKETGIQAKGRGTTIVVDNAQINTGNGILIQAMENDDPYMKAMMSGMGGGAGAPPAGMGASDEGMGSAAMVGMPATNANLSPDVVATFRNTALKGDVINARVTQGDLSLTLDNASLEGAVSTAFATPVGVPTEQNRRLIGAVKNAFGFVFHAKNGARVTLTPGSTWTVTRNSYLTELKLAEGATLKGAEGKPVTLQVNGTVTPLRAGTYTGKILVKLGS